MLDPKDYPDAEKAHPGLTDATNRMMEAFRETDPEKRRQLIAEFVEQNMAKEAERNAASTAQDRDKK